MPLGIQLFRCVQCHTFPKKPFVFHISVQGHLGIWIIYTTDVRGICANFREIPVELSEKFKTCENIAILPKHFIYAQGLICACKSGPT